MMHRQIALGLVLACPLPLRPLGVEEGCYGLCCFMLRIVHVANIAGTGRVRLGGFRPGTDSRDIRSAVLASGNECNDEPGNGFVGVVTRRGRLFSTGQPPLWHGDAFSDDLLFATGRERQ